MINCIGAHALDLSIKIPYSQYLKNVNVQYKKRRLPLQNCKQIGLFFCKLFSL